MNVIYYIEIFTLMALDTLYIHFLYQLHFSSEIFDCSAATDADIPFKVKLGTINKSKYYIQAYKTKIKSIIICNVLKITALIHKYAEIIQNENIFKYNLKGTNFS